MANIDNLNFKVIIDDSDFNRQIKQLEKEARRFNASMSSLLNIKKASAQISQQEIANNRRALQATVDQHRAQERINREKIKTEGLQRRINEQIERGSKGYQSQSSILQELKGYALGYLSIQGVSHLLSSLVRITGEFELQKTSLATMLGDLHAAESVISNIQALAVKSPFQFKELTTYAKQLSAFSVPAEELYETTKMLADISAGLGVGMDRLVLAFGQVKSAAFLRGQEVRQFTEAGIPILDELAKQFEKLEGRAVSTGEVFDRISARMVPFEMVAKVFKDLTSEGGKFYNMQEIQADTLRGKISNLKDAYEIMLNEIGEGQSERLKKSVDWIRKLIQNYEQTGRALMELVAAYGAYKAMLIALEIASNSFAVTNHKVLNSFVGIGKALLNNPYAVIAGVVTTAAFAIYKYATDLEGYEKVHAAFLKTQEEYASALVSETAKLDALYAKLQLAKEGTEEYNAAKKEIYSQYSTYIAELKEEGVEVENLAGLYDNLKIKLEEYTRAKFRSISQQELDQTFSNEVSEIRERYNSLLSKIEGLRKNAGEKALSAFDKEGLWQYITGDIDLWDMAEDPRLKTIKQTLRSNILPFGDMADEIRSDLAKIKKTYAEDLAAIQALYGEFVSTTQNTNLLPFAEDRGKPKAQERLEEQIDLVKRLQRAYEQLSSYVGDGTIKELLSKYYPEAKKEWIESLDFKAVMNALADELERYDKQAAKSLRNTIRDSNIDDEVEKFSELEKAYKNSADAAKKYFEAIRKLDTSDFNLDGSGIAFEIGKVANELQNKFNEIDLRAQKTFEILNQIDLSDAKAVEAVRNSFEKDFGEGSWDTFYEEFVKEGEDAIKLFAEKQARYERKIAQEKLNNLASRYVKDSLEGVDMSHWGDKSIRQIEAIRQRLVELMSSEIELPESTIAALREAGLKTADLQRAIKDLFNEKLTTVAEEKAKALIELGKRAVEQIRNLISELGELGDASNNKALSDTVKLLDDAAGVIDAAVKGFASGGWIGAIIGGVGALAGKLIDAATEAARVREEMREMEFEFLQAMQEFERLQLLDSFSGIFGDADFSKFIANLNIAGDSLDAIAQKMSEIHKYEKALAYAREQREKHANDPGFMYYDEQLTRPFSDSSVLFDKRTWWQRIFGGGDKNMKAFDLNSLFNESGKPIEAKFEELRVLYEQMGDSLTTEDKETVQTLLENWDVYIEAQTANADFLNSLFGDLASNIADSMINAFLEVGDAANGLEDVFEDLEQSIAKSLLTDFLLTNVLNKYKDELQKTFDASAGFSDADFWAAFEDTINQIEKDVEAIAPNVNEIFAGFDWGKGVEQTLGGSIKGITEDTANLLASYLNAIRADVSYSKTLWERMDANTQQIATILAGFSAPTLIDYQKRIEANTADIAFNTQRILSELQSVMTSEGGFTAIRTYS